jgi:hypothetical protein
LTDVAGVEGTGVLTAAEGLVDADTDVDLDAAALGFAGSSEPPKIQ